MGPAGLTSRFQVSTGWRYARATRGYFRFQQNGSFNQLWQPRERISVLDINAKYIFSPRFSVQADIPIVFNYFSQVFPIEGPELGVRHQLNASPKLGDISIYANYWLLKRKQHPLHNIAFGIGLKPPTGSWRLRQFYPNLQGTAASNRFIYPPAIMPGDGELGVIVGFDAYKTFAHPIPIRGTTIFAGAQYLITTRETNGTPSVVAEAGVPIPTQLKNRLVNGTPNTWNGQLGISIPAPHTSENEWLHGLRYQLVFRSEGVTAHDLFHGNSGFRQPGFTFSVGPGFLFAYKRDYLSVDIPINFVKYIDPSQDLVPGLPKIVNGIPQPNFSPTRNIGLVAPVGVQMRWTHTF
jgi:hypothetical protein